MHLRAAIWLLPAAAGIVGFLLTGHIAGSKERAALPPRKEMREPAGAVNSVADLQAGLTAIGARPAAGFRETDAGLATEDLKEQIRILTAKQKADDGDDWDHTSELRHRLTGLFKLLGEKDPASLQWVREHHPDSLFAFVGGWAGKDPEAVFGYITRSTTPNPCHPDTLMEVLRHLGATDPRGFLAATGKVPWELFLFSDDVFDQRPRLKSPGDQAIWVESGAAEALAKEGVDIDNLFSFWAAEDFDASMQAWTQWYEPETVAAASQLHGILHSKIKGGEASLTASFATLDETQMAKVRAAWRTLDSKKPWATEQLVKAFPSLRSWSTPAPAP